ALHGRDPQRMVAIVGPCSLHDAGSAFEFAERLRPLAQELRGELIVLMRAYIEKPRSTIGWKGLVSDPLLDGSCQMGLGLRRAREILLGIAARGVPCATEFVGTALPHYLGDLVSWAAIGARTSESQPHREMASGLEMPVGFKNATSGACGAALDATIAAAHPHSFLDIGADGVAAVLHTRGNRDTHIVLRGGSNGPNHDRASVAQAAQRLARTRQAQRGAVRGVLVDCSHDNSRRDHRAQPGVCRELIAQIREGAPGLLGAMLESHLHPGRQSWTPGAQLRYGVSITDACIGFAETETLLRELAGAVRSRRQRRRPPASREQAA
ncbi:MAG: 3-deoxy-7-phosphoheptulonate synthase, partial [Deltaproteobacteria bacterium]|nr:3-deoxy-7-phosphoheptulonate synthase [Deltaproteobacteria bacterium]